jgi:putative transposase
MQPINASHVDFLFAGSRMSCGIPTAEGHKIGRLHVSTRIKEMTIEALAAKNSMRASSLLHPLSLPPETPQGGMLLDR